MGELFKLSLILTVICSCAAFSLGFAYKQTKDPIAEQQRLKKMRALKEVFSGYDIPVGIPSSELIVGKDKDGKEIKQNFFLIKKEDDLLGIAFEMYPKGYGGDIHLLAGVTAEGNIAGVKVIRHVETPGLGANITAEEFSSQFKGLNLDKTTWTVKKNGGDIDQVTGATISSSAVINAVHDGLKLVMEHKSEIVSHKSEN